MGLLRLAARLPRGVIRGIAQGLGGLWYHLDARHRNIAMDNLRRAFGDELDDTQRRDICRRVFLHLAQVVMEFPCLTVVTNENLDSFATIHGAEHMESALAKGRGLLVLASHFGNWELMSLAYAVRCRPFTVVFRPLDNPFLNLLVDEIRLRGPKTIPKKGSVRQILRLLQRNEIVAILGDQNVDWYDGVFVPFFRDLACTNKALAVLAVRTGAPVVPIYNVRQADGSYAVIIKPAVDLISTGDTTSDIEENTALFNRIVEGYIRENPEQWLWLHQRWKTRNFRPWPLPPEEFAHYYSRQKRKRAGFAAATGENPS